MKKFLLAFVLLSGLAFAQKSQTIVQAFNAGTAVTGGTWIGYVPMNFVGGGCTASNTSGKFTINCAAAGGGDSITSPNSTLTVGGTASNTTLDVNLGNPNIWSNQTFIAPALGTPASGILTNATGYLWNNLTAAGGNLSIANGTNTSTFNQTANTNWIWANTTIATSGTTNASPVHNFVANYWTGAASAADTWTLGSSLASGTNGASTLTFAHSGSTGAALLAAPGFQGTGTNGGYSATEGTGANCAVGAGIDCIYPDSTAHDFHINANNTDMGAVVATTGTQTLSNKSFVTIVTSTKCAAAGSAANPSLVACSAAPAGLFSCATNASTGTCVVSTTAVTANSVIQIQPDSTLGAALSVTCNTTADSGVTAPRVSARSAGTSFTITLGTYTTNPECFSYVVIN